MIVIPHHLVPRHYLRHLLHLRRLLPLRRLLHLLRKDLVIIPNHHVVLIEKVLGRIINKSTYLEILQITQVQSKQQIKEDKTVKIDKVDAEDIDVVIANHLMIPPIHLVHLIHLVHPIHLAHPVVHPIHLVHPVVHPVVHLVVRHRLVLATLTIHEDEVHDLQKRFTYLVQRVHLDPRVLQV